ncbi:pilus assembly protein TadG-related protein [Streptomyces olivoreticuli]
MTRAAALRARGDGGQAFPIYVTAVAGLLFLALAFFAVGQAGANKNGAQTAADAAALAAAQSYRDQLRTGLLTALGTGAGWADWLSGRTGDPEAACGEAGTYARSNGAEVVGGCGTSAPGTLPAAFTVTVRSSAAVGRSVVPGTEDVHATATARAVVEPRCAGKSPESQKPPLDIVCDGRVVTIDPTRPDDLARALGALFSVRLAD